MAPIDQFSVNEILAEVLSGKKARWIEPSLVGSIATREMRSGGGRKETVKRIRAKLHQVSGAFREEQTDYASLLSLFDELTFPPAAEALQSVCLNAMARHASTRERLPILKDFYAWLFAQLPPIHRVLDLACGLNPLARPWMTLTKDADYIACDLYDDMARLINGFFEKTGYAGQALSQNVLNAIPEGHFNLVLALKTVPCLEQADKTAGRRLLKQLEDRADFAFITFPARSLSGRGKGMPANYEAHFHTLYDPEQWAIEKISFPSELGFLMRSLKTEPVSSSPNSSFSEGLP